MPNAYRIKNWDSIFENNESRKLKKLNWVPIPNTWDGLGYVRVTKHKNAVSILAAWPLVIQIGSKCPQRGLLAKVDAPLSVEDMSDLTRMPAELFVRAFDALIHPSIGWVELVEIQKSDGLWKIIESPDTPGDSPDPSGMSGVEQNRTEWKEQNGNKAAGAVLIPDCLQALAGFSSEWQNFRIHRKRRRSPLTQRAEELILTRLAERPHQALEALKTVMEYDWKSFKWHWIENQKGNKNGTNSETRRKGVGSTHDPTGTVAAQY